MFEAIDLYCERTSPDFWAEPVNALTNIAFLITAWLAWRHATKLQATSSGLWLMLAFLCAIAVGSGLFHTFANNWSRLLDVLPILFFQLIYIWAYCRLIVKMNMGYAISIILVYLLAAIVGRQFPNILNGSLIYAPAMLILLILGAYHAATGRIERYVLLCAAGVFVVSLTCRTVDGVVCPYFPLGTHFLWHVCNAFMLYLLLRGFLANAFVENRPDEAIKARTFRGMNKLSGDTSAR